MRHFAHNIGDYAAATAHLSFIEDAAYHRLLRRYYQDEQALPGDVKAVQRLVGARTKEEREAVANVLAEFFHLEGDGYHQDRADREIETYHSKADAARANGTKGGRPANRRKTNPVSDPVRCEKLTTPHSPLNSSEANASGGQVPPREVIFAECLPWMMRKAGVDRAACAKLIGKLLQAGDDAAVLEALQQAEKHDAADPFTYAKAVLKPKPDTHETFDQRRIREGLEVINAYGAQHDSH